MTLLEGSLKQSYRLLHMELEEAVTRRLQMLGMTKDAEILLVNRKRDGSTIIKVRGTRFAIGKSYAQGIYVGDAENVKE